MDDCTDATTTLYVYRDKIGAVIYVGITGQGRRRADQHAGKSGWWRFVATAEFTHYPTRELAAAAEIEMIRKYRPIYNVQHSLDNDDLRSAYIEHGVGRGGTTLATRDAARGLSDGDRIVLPLDPHLDPAMRRLTKAADRLVMCGVRAADVSVDDDEQTVIIKMRRPVPKGPVVLWRLPGQGWRLDLETGADLIGLVG